MSEESEWVSKSQLKRDADRVLELVQQLLHLKAAELAQIPLSAPFLQGLVDVKKIPQRGAQKRHIKWLAKQLRGEALDDIETALGRVIKSRQGETATFHLIEHWRTRLIEEDNQALSNFIEEYQPNDIQQLRQLVRQAKKERASEQNQGAVRALFRYLRAIIE